jgi:hypothetical protein
MMEFDEIQRRLELISVIWTPTRQYENRIVSVQGDRVTVRSSQDGSQDREILFQEILDGNTPWNSRIIRSFRQILGLQLLPYDPAHPPPDDQ